MSFTEQLDLDHEPTLKDTYHALARLITTLDPIAKFFELELEQSSESIAILRGKANDLYYAGTIYVKDTGYDVDFDAPFARVAWYDFDVNGPFNFATQADRGVLGPGTVTAGAGSAGVVPLIGRHLSIFGATGALFLAVFATTGSLNVKP